MSSKNKQGQRKLKISKIAGLVLGLFFCVFSLAKASDRTDAVRAEIIKLANQERAGLGLSVLTENPVLNQAAGLKVSDMLKENYFSHTSPAGIDPWHWFEEAGYGYKYAGENLAMDFGSAASVHRAWMKSPTHKENIISEKFSEIGVAVQEGILDGRETLLAVQLFGTQDKQTALLKEILLQSGEVSLSIKESSVFPWKNSLGKNEALIFAEVVGPADSVKAEINGQSYPLEKIRENNYLSLVSLDNWKPEKDQVVIHAKSSFGWEVSELILQKKYFGYFQEQNAQTKDFFSGMKSQSVLTAGKTAEVSSENSLPWEKIQNGALLFGVLVFFLTIGNIWILEKEEERLLLNKCA